MLRSLWIKIPALVLTVIAYFAAGGGSAGVVAAFVVFGLGGLVLMGVVFHPNASFWATTLSRAPRTTDAVALTFDDGPDPATTLEIATLLEARSIRAAFFVVGERAERYPDIVERLHAAGHLICNHSNTHSMRFHFSLWEGFRRELAACNQTIGRLIGKEPTLFRAPQGAKNPALGDVLNEMGMTAIGWQVRAFDAVVSDPKVIERRVLENVRGGSIILLHDGAGLGGTHNRQPTLRALPRILDGIEDRGLRFARLDALLEVAPYRDVS